MVVLPGSPHLSIYNAEEELAVLELSTLTFPAVVVLRRIFSAGPFRGLGGSLLLDENV